MPIKTEGMVQKEGGKPTANAAGRLILGEIGETEVCQVHRQVLKANDMRIQPKRSVANRCGAFTIVEVVVSIVIIGVGAAGLMAGIGYGFKTIQRVRENQRATQIILEKAETIRLFSWDQVSSNGFIPSTFTATYDGDATASSNYSGTVYNGTVTIGNFPNSTSYTDRMKALTLTLQWQTETISRTRVLTTYIAKDGIQNYVY